MECSGYFRNKYLTVSKISKFLPKKKEKYPIHNYLFVVSDNFFFVV